MAKRMRFPKSERCSQTGKVAHPDYYSAARHMKALARHGRHGIRKMKAYRCKHCENWHVGNG